MKMDDKSLDKCLGKKVQVQFLDWGEARIIEGILTKFSSKHLFIDKIMIPRKGICIEEII